MTHAEIATVDWTEHYEALRTHALGEALVAFTPLGLGVLYQRGVAGWMKWKAVAESAGNSLSVNKRVQKQSDANLSREQVELIQLLAETVLLVTTARSA